MRTVSESAEYRIENDDLYLRYKSKSGDTWELERIEHEAYSAFPQFAWVRPSKDAPVLDPLNEIIELDVVSKSSVVPSSVVLVLDDHLPDATTVYAGAPGFSVTPSSESGHARVKYAVPPVYWLPPGEHAVTVYASNLLDLRDGSRLVFTVPDTNDTALLAWEDAGPLPFMSGGQRGSNTPATAHWLHTERVVFRSTSSAAPLTDFVIYEDDTMGTELYRRDFVPGTRSADISEALTGFPDKTEYYALLRDELGRATSMYFHLDKAGPVIVTTVTARLNESHTGLLYGARGRATDSMSGLGTGVMLLEPGTTVQYDGPTYPPGAEATDFSFADIPSELSLAVFDRAGWPAYYNLQTSEISGTLQVVTYTPPLDGIGHDYSNGLAGNVGTILKTARLTTGGLLGVDANIRFKDEDRPTGMRVELWAESSGEGLSPDVPPYIPLVYGYGRTGERRLFTGRGFDSQSDTFNLPMKEYLELHLVSYGNTNTGVYEVHVDTDDDGDLDIWREVEYGTGTFHLEADGWAAASAQSLGGMAHFYQWIPAGDIQRLETGLVSLDIRGVTRPGVITVDTARRTLSQPGYKMAGEDIIYEIKTDAEFTGPIKLFMGVNHPSHTGEQNTSPVIMHCPAGPDACEKLETASDGFTASAELTSLSPFGIMVPLDDVTPPRTEFALIGERQYSENQFLVTPETYVDLTAADLANIGDVSGVAGTYALVDHEPTTECLAAPYDPAAPAGTCANPRYGGIFPLPEGAHTVYYASYDHWGNREEFRSRGLLSDGTPPRTEFFWNLGEEVIYCGDTPCLGLSDDLGLNATDPVSGGVSSSVEFTALLIDVPPESCGGFDETDPQAPFGTCLNPVYTEQFALPAGPHTLYYFSVDKAGNFESPNSTSAFVDGVAPEVTLYADGVDVPDGGSAFLAAGASVTLTAFDPLSDGFAAGIDEAEYLIDVTFDSCPPEEEGGDGEESGDGGEGGGEEGEDGEDEEEDGPRGTCGYSGYEGPFTLTPGTHTVYYLAHDMVGNTSAVRTAYFTVGTSSDAAEASIMPSSGPIGLPFTITGEGFGAYSAGTTLALIGGATAPLTLWTDTQIKGTVPGSLAAGESPVLVMRGNELLAETSSFTVVVPALADITPSSGPIGLPFTLNGTGFGNYVANYTRVLIGGTTCPLTLWTDTQIKGTVPGTIEPGTHEVVVERQLNGGLTVSQPLAFTLTVPALSDITPSSGPIGLPFALNGSGFGNYVANYTRVLIGGTTCPLTLWTDTQIKGTIPGTIAPGIHEVLVERELNGGLVRSATVMFDLRNMEADWIAPSSGPIGMPFMIAGSGFGNYVANYTTVLMGGTTCPLTLWTDGQIKGTVPGGLATGQYPVLVERRTADGGLMHSPAMSFTVLAVDAASMTPVAGPIGLPFTIHGAGFGNYSAGWTRVLIGGTTAPLTLWSDTQIKGTVPGVLAAGPHEVIVERELNGGLIRSSALNFDVLTPSAQLIRPSSGPIGLPFVLDGTGFGNYVANYTRVLIGGTTCPLTLWTDTQIKGTVPGTIEPGAHEVIVQRQLNGGVVASQPLPFTLTVPALAAITPSSGPIGLPFTLTGSGFGNYVANNAKVLIGGTTAPLTLWTDGQIKGTVPGTIEPGTHEVLVERAFNGGVAQSQALSFELAGPVLETVSPSPAAVLSPFTLTGYNFGNYVAGKSETLIGGATAQLTLWTDTQIKGKLPALGEGDYPVLVRRSFNGGVSQSAPSTMTIVEPSVSSMTPVSGQPGGGFSVFGAFFGPYDAAIARVLIGGLPGSLSLWTDGRINGVVPAELGVGTHTVIVSRGQYQADPLEFYVPEGGGYSPSFLSPLSPSAAFRLGEVYVYPNPAKGGVVPVFHLEFGLADKVELKVYSVAGTLVHERTLTGPPQMTSPVYAYEYAWEGNIASGVYYFTVEAERSGSKLKARGKFAVVR